MRHSIRTFLLVALLLAMGAVGALITAAGYLGSLREADELFDAQLAQYGRTLAPLFADRVAGPPLIVDWQTDRPAAGHPYEGKIAFEVWRDDGSPVARSASLPAFPRRELTPGFGDAWWAGHRWRLFTLHDPASGHWILTAQRGDIRGELAQQIAWEAAVPLLVGGPLAALLIWWILGRGLQPLYWLSDQLRQREAHDLTPLPATALPAELQQLTLSANDLLHRLASAFGRERRFASDAAHELRTPIAGLLIHLENALAEVPEGYRESLTNAQLSARRLQAIVEQLLALARLAPERYLATLAPVDLVEVAREVLAELAPQAAAGGHRLLLEGAARAVLDGERTALAILLRNLVVNAINYMAKPGVVRVTIGARKGIELSVSDEGPGIAQELRERVFDRFYRVGGDRHQSHTEGAGLGLAIVRQIAELHGATITLADADPAARAGGRTEPGLRVTLRFAQPVQHEQRDRSAPSPPPAARTGQRQRRLRWPR